MNNISIHSCSTSERPPPNRAAQVLVLLLAFGISLLIACETVTKKTSPSEALGTGDSAPDFTLSDAHGGTFTLSKSNKTTILIFYLSYECPRCTRNLKELAKHVAEFEKAGAQIVAISPDTVEFTRQSIRDFGDMPYPLLADPDKNIAAAYGLVRANDDDILHAAFVINAEGKIQFATRSNHPYDNIKGLLDEAKRLQKSD
jgi:peroxiredoxin Q/BCP